jgi:RNA polymerase sigma-70 factor (sigma-E family)
VAEADVEFDAFVRLRGPRLLRLAMLLTAEAGAAEDLLQSVLEKLYGQWIKRPPDDPDAYARAALVHAARRSWRRRLTRPETLVAELPERNADGGDSTLRDSLLTAMRGLSARQRAVIALRYFDGYSEVETADLLGSGVGAVKTHAHRALRRLRDDPALGDYLNAMKEA